jgi:hypothetical protein
MKHQLRALIIMVLLVLGSAPMPAQAAPLTATVTVTAWVSNRAPVQNTNVIAFVQVKLDGKTRAKISVTFTWNFKSGTKTCTAKTDYRGIAWCRLNVGLAPQATRVPIEGKLTIDGKSYSAKTSFTPTIAGSTPATAVPTAVPVPTKPRPNK